MINKKKMSKKLYIHTFSGELYSIVPVWDSPYNDTIDRLWSNIWNEFDGRKNLLYLITKSCGGNDGVEICELNTLSRPSKLLLNLNNLVSIELVEEEKKEEVNVQ